MAATNGRTLTAFGGTGFVAASFGICALADFLFESRQGIRIGGIGCLVLMIRNFNP